MVLKTKPKNVHKHKIRRGGKHNNVKNKSEKNSMIIVGTNSAGLMNKKESFFRTIKTLCPSVYFVQETKARRKNKIKLNDYVTFEHVRKNKGGGGLLTAVHRNLEPVNIATNEETEILVVEAKIGKDKTRFINAYGPQETCEDTTKQEFYNQLDIEVKKSKLAGALVCIEMDANAKLGKKLIPKDPHPQSKNGKLLENFVEDNDLVVVNGTSLCEGVITRKRITVANKEESVLDYYIVCKSFFKLVVKMKIDEERKHSLTKYSTTKGRQSIKESDHNPLILEINVNWNSHFNDRSVRVETFNFADAEAFDRYKNLTETNQELLECFEDEDEDLQTSANRWLKRFENVLQRSF